MSEYPRRTRRDAPEPGLYDAVARFMTGFLLGVATVLIAVLGLIMALR